MIINYSRHSLETHSASQFLYFLFRIFYFATKKWGKFFLLHNNCLQGIWTLKGVDEMKLKWGKPFPPSNYILGGGGGTGLKWGGGGGGTIPTGGGGIPAMPAGGMGGLGGRTIAGGGGGGMPAWGGIPPSWGGPLGGPRPPPLPPPSALNANCKKACVVTNSNYLCRLFPQLMVCQVQH